MSCIGVFTLADAPAPGYFIRVDFSSHRVQHVRDYRDVTDIAQDARFDDRR